jgi:hypothetical protein
VQLRREPPVFVPVVKETSHDSAKVESRVQLSAGTPISVQSSLSVERTRLGVRFVRSACTIFRRRGRKVMRAFCKRTQAGALPAAGSSCPWACGVISSTPSCEGGGVGATPTFAHQFP